jgi:hypothetical protein
MLAKIAQGGSEPLRLVYVIGQGKSQGQLREYVVTYGAPNPHKFKTGTTHPTRSPRKRHIDSGNIPFTEFGTQRMLTLFSYNIIKFNGKQVIC